MALTEAEIEAQKSAILTALQDLAENPKPSYKVGTRSFDWNGYQDRLLKQLDFLDKQLERIPGEAETYYDDPDL